MRILHFGSNYLPSKGGNVVRMTSMLENNKSDAELFIMTTAKQADFDDDLYYKEKGIKIFRINQLDDAYSCLPEIVKQYSIDVVVTHLIPANIIACKCVPKNVKIMTEIHSLIDSGKIKNLGKALLHRLILNKRTSRFFVLSQGSAEYIKKHYGVSENKITFLPNSCQKDNLRFSSGNPDYFTFGYVGTFYNWQGINNIYNSAEKILSIDDSVRLYLVGGGKMEDELKALSQKYPNRLILTGLVPKAEVPNHLKEIDVLMIPRPSTLETETAIPLKIFDSVEAGKPVIISDVFGLKEVLSEDEAYVYSASDTNGLYNACLTAFNNKSGGKVLFEKAKKKLESWPSWDEIHKRQFDAICGDLKK